MLALADISQELLRRERSTDEAPRRLLYRDRVSFSFRDGESLRGGMARACELAGAPNSWTVLREVGLKHRNRVLVSEDPDIDIGALAEALGVTREEVAARQYPEKENGAREYFGMIVPAGSIESRARRYSPTFLRDRGYHLAAWELKFLPFCPVTWDMLLQHCDACRSQPPQAQGWVRTLTPVDRCDECGRRLADRSTSNVSEGLRPALEIISCLVRCTEKKRASVFDLLPSDLGRADPQALLDVILGLAKHMKPSPTEEDSDPQVIRLHRACKAVQSWPTGLDDIEFSASPTGPILPPLMQTYAALGAESAIDAAEAEYASIRAMNHSTCGDELDRIVGLREASAISGLEDDTLRAAWEACLITRRYRAHGNRLLPAFEVRELLAFAEAWRTRVSASSVASRFGLPTYAIEQCVIRGHLIPTALSLPGSGYFFSKQAADRFCDETSLKQPAPHVATVALYDLMRLVSGRLKPWGEVLSAVALGRISAKLEPGDDNQLAKRLQIDESSAKYLIGKEAAKGVPSLCGLSSTICQSDAYEVLNCSATSSGMLDGIASTGINPKLFPLELVAKRAGEVVATSEIAKHLDLDPTRTSRLLSAARVREIVPGGWDRVHAFELINRATLMRDAQLSLIF